MSEFFTPPIPGSFQDQKFREALCSLLNAKCRKGPTANRPTFGPQEFGRMYLDTTLHANGMPIWWQGTKWVKSDGTDA